MVQGRMLKLRRPDTCVVCGQSLSVGAEAFWDPAARVVTCAACVASTPPPPPAPGVAGRSARAEGQRRLTAEQERRRADIERRPVLGRISNFLQGPSTAGASYSKGAVGEEKLGAALDRLTGQGLSVLHDRRRPRTTANIDHLVVAPTGVWVIDAKRYSGLIQRVDKGGWLRTDHRLIVDGRDRTALVAGVHRQVVDVHHVLDGVDFDIAIHGALCFVDAEFRLFARPFKINGVLVTGLRALLARLIEPGRLDQATRAVVLQQLANRLPPAA